jgi:hypothetical protein
MILKLLLVGTVQVGVANSTARRRGSCDTVRWLGIPTNSALHLASFNVLKIAACSGSEMIFSLKLSGPCKGFLNSPKLVTDVCNVSRVLETITF